MLFFMPFSQVIVLFSNAFVVLAAQTGPEIKAGLAELLVNLQNLKETVNGINPVATGDYFECVLGNMGAYKVRDAVVTEGIISSVSGQLRSSYLDTDTLFRLPRTNRTSSRPRKTNSFAIQAAGSTGISATDAQDIINYYNNQFGLEVFNMGNSIGQKACLFSTTPDVGAAFANSLGALRGAFTSYTTSLRNISPTVSFGILSIFSVDYILLQSARTAYQGALCTVTG